MISSERTAEIYQAMYLHYTKDNYDYYKYNGRLRKQPENVQKVFSIIANKLDSAEKVEEFFGFNMADLYVSALGISNNPHSYNNNEAYVSYHQWVKFMADFDNHFQKYVKTKERLKSLIEPMENGQVPFLIDTIQRKIPIDFLATMLYNFKNLEDKWKSNDPLQMDLLKHAKKHAIFLENRHKISKNLPGIIKNLDK